MFGGDNELGNILQEAVKIKSAQMGQKRKTYETWPYFVQHTLFHGEKEDFKAWRQLPFPEKMKISERIKEDGNKLYAEQKWSDAADKYEEAATLVYYCYSTDPGWRKNNRGIDDDVLVLVDDNGSDEQEEQQQRRLRLTCCLNLAACKLHLQKFDEAIVACDTALELDPGNVKALYRRADARTRPAKSTAYEHDLAIKDLALANKNAPDNQTVNKLLAELRGERKVQREKDKKTFTGMFDRGTIYKGENGEPIQNLSQAEVDMQTIQNRIDGISDEDTLEKRTADAELLRDLYMRNGKEDEAKELHDKIVVAKKALKERDRPSLDWDQPTQEMIEDAKNYDLDLTDPVVLAELKRLEKEGLGSLPPEDDAVQPNSSSPASYDLPLPEADCDTPIPWMRYVILFAVMVVVWKLLDAGVIGWIFMFVWRRFFVRGFELVGGTTSDDTDTESDRGSLFATAYRKIVTLLGGEVDDNEL